MTNLTQAERQWCEGKPKRKKPRKRTVYVLTGSFRYENTDVLGVYSTRLRSEKARDLQPGGYDFYSFDDIVVDA